jgi:hypothetical protein
MTMINAQPVTILFDDAAWQGYRAQGFLYFDFETPERKAIRFFVFPEKCVMLVHRPWPVAFAPYTEWLVHLVSAKAEDRQQLAWKVVDREIDVIVEPDLQTYRVIDLNDFGEAVAKGRIMPEDVRRLLTALQVFLDDYLHGGGRFPPAEIAKLAMEKPQPARIGADRVGPSRKAPS